MLSPTFTVPLELFMLAPHSVGKGLQLKFLAIAAMRFDTNRRPVTRSEEHTSELQSLTNLVCRLLLEKKKKYKKEGPCETLRQSNTLWRKGARTATSRTSQLTYLGSSAAFLTRC